MNYHEKYLKYKTKYSNLKKLIGGEITYEFEEFDNSAINDTLSTYSNNWFIIKCGDHDAIPTICKYIKKETHSDERPPGMDPDIMWFGSSSTTYSFQDVHGENITHTKNVGDYRDSGTLASCKKYIIKNVKNDTILNDDMIKTIITKLNDKYSNESASTRLVAF